MGRVLCLTLTCPCKPSALLILVCRCRFAVLAGDPMQLPPLIANPAQPQQRGGMPVHGLLRPLFARLMAAGHPVHLLRRQYRWAPLQPCALLHHSPGWHRISMLLCVHAGPWAAVMTRSRTCVPLYYNPLVAVHQHASVHTCWSLHVPWGPAMIWSQRPPPNV